MATKWFKIGSRPPQDVPRWLQVGQDGRELAQSGSKRGPRSATWAKMALKLIQQGLKITSLSYFVPTSFFFPSLFFSFGEPFPLEKKALVKYPPCIAIVRFSLLYSNYQTLSYCSICQTSLPLYYLPYTSPCITLVTSFPCIVLVYDLSNASSCKTLVKCRPQYHMPLYNTCQLLPCVALVQSSCIISCYDAFSHSTESVHRTGLKNTLRRWQLSQ
jgi:hypothetical protein